MSGNGDLKNITVTPEQLQTLQTECISVMEATPDMLKIFCRQAGMPEPTKDDIKKISTLTAGVLSGKYEYAGFGVSDTTTLGLLLSGSKLSVSAMREVAKQCSIINTCVDSWTWKISNTKWKIEAIEGYKERPTIKARVEAFFKKPLYYEYGYNFRKFMSQSVRDLAIVDWNLIEKIKSKNGRLMGLTPLDVGIYTTKFNEKRGYPEYYYVEDMLKKGKAEKSQIPAQDAISIFMNPCTESGYGNSPIEGILEEIGMLVYSTIAIRKNFTHGEIPEGLLNLGMISRATADDIESDMMTKAGQPWKLRILWGLATAQWLELKRSHSDQQLSELRTAFEKIVYRKYGFSPIEMAETDSSKGSSREQKNLGRSRLFNPVMNAYKEQFDYVIAEDFGAPDMEFNWYPFEIEDQESLARSYDRHQDMGAMTVNSRRRKLGEPTVEGGDEPYIKVGNDIILVKDLPDYKSGLIQQQTQNNGQDNGQEDGQEGQQDQENTGE